MEVTIKPNRDKKTKPKRAQFWCFGCDRNIVSPNEKCELCGFKERNKRRKK